MGEEMGVDVIRAGVSPPEGGSLQAFVVWRPYLLP
jgi:hypothetical protein